MPEIQIKTTDYLKNMDSQKHIIGNQELCVTEDIERLGHHQQKHVDAGQLLKSIIYGGLDGSTAIIIVILSGVSSNTDPYKILGIAVSALIGDALGMGLGDYLSAKAQIQYIEHEKKREIYEIDNLLDDEKKEIIDIYTEIDPITQQAKYSLDDATRIADLYATNKEAFTKIMMLQELQLVSIDPIMAKKCGFATFLAFLLFGLLPVIPYIISSGIMKKQDQQWIAVMVIGAVELFSLGIGKAALIGLPVWKSGFETLAFGAFICAVGYGLGFAFPG